MVSCLMAPQIADLFSRQELDQQMVRTAFTILLYIQVDLMPSQSPKILSSDPRKQRLLLPLGQGATAKYQIIHSDQASPTPMMLLSRMIVRHSKTDTPEMGRELKETERNVTPNRAQPRTDEVSRMTAISGPMFGNRGTQVMTITGVRIRRMEIVSMNGIERLGVSIERIEDLRTTSEMLIPTLAEVMHRGVVVPQEGAMSPLGIERKVAIETAALKIRKIQSPGNGRIKRGEVLAGQSVTGIEVGK